MKPKSAGLTRREWLQRGSLALAALPLVPVVARAESPQKDPLFSAIGTAASIDKAAVMKEAGAAFLTAGVGDLLVPDKSDEAFAKLREKAAACPLPILACNGFIRPAHLRCVGPEANPDQVLVWAETAFRRLKQIHGKFIVFGSSGARRIPEGWPRAKADAQFVELLKRMGPLAEKHGVTVTVEQLQESECNYINRIGEAASLIRQANHPNIRLLADLFHMMRVGDSPEDLKAALDVVVHMEIAEKANRTVPGVDGDDFRPFFRVLRAGGYRGAISIEGKGTDAQYAIAFKTIASQAAES